MLEAGDYLVQTFRLVATDFGLPQRRVRIYLVGFCKNRHPDVSFQRMERHISMMRLKCQLPDSCLRLELVVVSLSSIVIVIVIVCFFLAKFKSFLIQNLTPRI